MSTHDIGFYDEMGKIILQLSSNTHFVCSSCEETYKGARKSLRKREQ